MTRTDRELTIETIMEEIERNGIANQGDTNPENGQVKTQPDGYLYEIKTDTSGDWAVTYKGKGEVEISNILISLRKSTEVITNQVVITMVAKANDGIASYTEPKGTTPTKTYPSGTNEITETYTVTDNGVYTFTVQNNNGTTETKSITINNILNGTIPMEVSTSLPTNQNVIVTITWPSGSEKAVKEVKVGEGSWQTEIGSVTKVEVAQNCTVEARVRNSSTDIITRNITISNIDKTDPTVELETAGTETIVLGDSNSISKYFKCTANGIYGIETKTYTDISNGNVEVTNTSTLSEGTHTIRCTATKETGATGYADKTIIVKNYWDGQVNAPVTVTGMIPVYYDTGDSTGSPWKKADTTNTDLGKKWYSYTSSEKRWANVVTVATANLSKYENAAAGTTIAQSEITAMFVWIPRYSYTVDADNKNIQVSFLQNRTNKDATGVATTKTVHPVFTDGSLNNYAQGGWDEELTGYWVAKFEASGVENGNPVGNGSASKDEQTQAPTPSTYVRILPNVISWRYNTIGEAQYRSMQMSSNTTAYGWTNGAVDSHLIKNDEWGGVAYLCYSEYGAVPMTNGCAALSSNSQYNYDFYTGAGPYSGTTRANASEDGTYEYSASHAYNTANGVLSSTTGNVYGIYDMAGGNWEIVAGYLNNGNSIVFRDYGYSTTNNNIKYFAKNAEKSTDTYDFYDVVDPNNNQKYWNRYEVSEEERTNVVKINSTTTLTQNELWDKNLKTSEYNAARLRITGVNYENMKKVKGIGIGEGISSSYAYFGVNSSGSRDWYTEAAASTVTYGRAWDSDLTLIGHARFPFFGRGGDCIYRADAGVLCTDFTGGGVYYRIGFRPAVVVPCT